MDNKGPAKKPTIQVDRRRRPGSRAARQTGQRAEAPERSDEQRGTSGGGYRPTSSGGSSSSGGSQIPVTALLPPAQEAPLVGHLAADLCVRGIYPAFFKWRRGAGKCHLCGTHGCLCG